MTNTCGIFIAALWKVKPDTILCLLTWPKLILIKKKFAAGGKNGWTMNEDYDEMEVRGDRIH